MELHRGWASCLTLENFLLGFFLGVARQVLTMGWLYLIHFGNKEQFYIGATVTSTERRRWMHIDAMRHGKASAKMQAAYNRAGEAAMVFIPLRELEPPLLYEREDEMIWKLRPPLNTKPGYAAIARKAGLHESTVRRRAERGLDATLPKHQVPRAVHKPYDVERHNIMGEWLTVREICEKYGMSLSTVYNRFSQGLNGASIVAVARRGRPRKS